MKRQRNPIITDVFYRTGLIEEWGRGTNRVIDMCREAGVRAPEFAEITGAAVVTFRAPVAEGRTTARQVTGQVTGQVVCLPGAMRCRGPCEALCRARRFSVSSD